MTHKSTTYNIEDGRVETPLGPVIIINKKGKRKINPRFEEMVKNVPQEIKDRVEKVMTCKWLRNGDECGKGLPGTPCEVVGCVAWEHYKEDNFVENMKGVFERNKKHQENPLLVSESMYETAVKIARENNIPVRIESVKGRWKKKDEK